MKILIFVMLILTPMVISAQTPPIEPGVSQELARWRAARYSDVRYKLNLTLEKMSPVLKGTMEIRVRVGEKGSGGEKPGTQAPSPASPQRGEVAPIILDWRKIKGHEEKSKISNVSINGVVAEFLEMNTNLLETPRKPTYTEHAEHLIFWNSGAGENVIKLDFTSPILPSGSAITRYVDKEDGSEYIYSLFVPSDASTAFPVFDQPDLKARFQLTASLPDDWEMVSNSPAETIIGTAKPAGWPHSIWCPNGNCPPNIKFPDWTHESVFPSTKPISTYVFAFAAGPFARFEDGGVVQRRLVRGLPVVDAPVDAEKQADREKVRPSIYVRKSQGEKFKSHAAEVFRLNREAVKYFEQYFDYKFPFPKYDLVLIPEFPFGGMEHAGATFLRESSIIFPQEPTKNDLVSRATLIFHEAAHQWFGDTVTMRWFDDLWLKEGFATFTAYKAMEKIMPEMNAWKVFYERIKQGAYQTDSTRGTTAIYQPIANLSAAKSAYGNIVYNKAPAFLRQAEFFLGEREFQTAVRAFLRKHEFGNAGWEDLVKEFEEVWGANLDRWAEKWVTERGLPIVRGSVSSSEKGCFTLDFRESFDGKEIVDGWRMRIKTLMRFTKTSRSVDHELWGISGFAGCDGAPPRLLLPNYGDYGYGIFLLDEKSRDHVLKNIQNEKDPFLRSMMWGALWDSVREGEMDPRVFVELVVKVLMRKPAREQGRNEQRPDYALAYAQASASDEDESTVATLLGRTGTALNYYVSVPPAVAGGDRETAGAKAPPATAGGTDKNADLRGRVEDMLIERMQNAPSLGQRITYYRAFLNIASSEKARDVLKRLLRESVPPAVAGGDRAPAAKAPPTTVGGTDKSIPIKTKDKFDIVTRLLILGDREAPELLADLEKAETSDDAKRYAYAAKAGIGTAANKAKYWNDFVNNKEISESWIEAAFGPWNSIRHSELTLPYLQKALQELPNHKRNRKIFFVNGWLGAFIGGQRSEEALGVVNKFLADNPKIDNDLRLKILENVDVIERAVRIRGKN